MDLFSTAAVEFWLRWLHYLFGILWLGHLYYFNFSQAPFLAEIDSPTLSQVQRKLFPKTLFWLKWGSGITLLTGWLMVGHRLGMGASITSPWGTLIFSGGILGTLMFLNVMFIIWSKQKTIIEDANRVAQGETAREPVHLLAAHAAVASRINTLFSIPLLFFMAAASHLPLSISDEKSLVPYWSIFTIIVGLIELAAIKGTMGPLKKLVAVIHFGVLLTLILYFALAFLTA